MIGDVILRTFLLSIIRALSLSVFTKSFGTLTPSPDMRSDSLRLMLLSRERAITLLTRGGINGLTSKLLSMLTLCLAHRFALLTERILISPSPPLLPLPFLPRELRPLLLQVHPLLRRLLQLRLLSPLRCEGTLRLPGSSLRGVRLLLLLLL